MGVAGCHFYEPSWFLIGFVEDPPSSVGAQLERPSSDCHHVSQRWRRLTSSPQPLTSAALHRADGAVVRNHRPGVRRSAGLTIGMFCSLAFLL